MATHSEEFFPLLTPDALFFGDKALPRLVVVEDANLRDFSLRLVYIFYLILWCGRSW